MWNRWTIHFLFFFAKRNILMTFQNQIAFFLRWLPRMKEEATTSCHAWQERESGCESPWVIKGFRTVETFRSTEGESFSFFPLLFGKRLTHPWWPDGPASPNIYSSWQKSLTTEKILYRHPTSYRMYHPLFSFSIVTLKFYTFYPFYRIAIQLNDRIVADLPVS